MKTLALMISILVFTSSASAEWMFDFSRRQEEMVEQEKRAQVYKEEKKSLLDMVTERQAPMQDLVIINSNAGFYPPQISVQKNQRYKVHVVNINKEQKNLSFMMDAFSQHHGTYFGEKVSFTIEPRREGLFDFQCPETGAKGQFVVSGSNIPVESPLESIKLRRPASE